MLCRNYSRALCVSNEAVSRGHLITFEGGEGAGKSTQMKRLREWLKDQGRTVLTTREPGGTPGAEAVRHAVLSGAVKDLGTTAEAVMFAAARADNVLNVIRPALLRGEIVLCDRYLDSSRVYQGIAGGVPASIIEPLQAAATEGASPDLTLMFDIDPVLGLERAAQVWAEDGPDRYEQDKLEQQRERREAFRAIAEREPHRCVLIDAADTPDAVFDTMRTAVSSYLEAHD
ncbi:MAG: dTMP kinase [Pseudomonadota bacterium]